MRRAWLSSGKILILLLTFVLLFSGTATGSPGHGLSEDPLKVSSGVDYTESVPAASDSTICQADLKSSDIVVEGESDGGDSDGSVGKSEDEDGDVIFHSIQAAVNEAEDGETVCVLPGTYRERVSIRDDILLVAPAGATLNGSDFDLVNGGADGPFGITIADDSSPTIDGFTITIYADGILDYGGTGDWTVTNVTVKDTLDDGIGAQFTTGDWTIKNTVIDNTSRLGIHVGKGDWTIKNTTIRNTPQVAIEKTQEDGGNWTVTNTTIRNPGGVGIRVYPGNLTVRNTRIVGASYAAISSNRFATYTGDMHRTWIIENTTVRENGFGLFDAGTDLNWVVINSVVSKNEKTGIAAVKSSGEWKIRSTQVLRNGHSGATLSQSQGDWFISDSKFTQNSEGAVIAEGTRGSITIHNTTFIDNSAFEINAKGSEHSVNATKNWWGSPDGPKSNNCIGQAICDNWLHSPPDKPLSPETPTSTDQVQSSTISPTETERPQTPEAAESSSTPTPTSASGPGFTVTGTIAVLTAIIIFGREIIL